MLHSAMVLSATQGIFCRGDQSSGMSMGCVFQHPRVLTLLSPKTIPHGFNLNKPHMIDKLAHKKYSSIYIAQILIFIFS